MAALDAPTTPKKCKIIIIGAGMAGLSAANHLIKNGLSDFVVLEARKRIGGRIVSIKLGKQFEIIIVLGLQTRLWLDFVAHPTDRARLVRPTVFLN